MKKVRDTYLFEATVWFDNDIEEGWGTQKRYIVADSEEECEAKLIAHAKQLKKDGYANLHWLPDFKCESVLL